MHKWNLQIQHVPIMSSVLESDDLYADILNDLQSKPLTNRIAKEQTLIDIETIKTLNLENSVLRTNISTLYRTAMKELEKKDAEIRALRVELLKKV